MSADLTPALPADIFQMIFEKSPGSLLVRGDAPCFTIVAVSDAYLEITSSKRETILGRGFCEVFPDDKAPYDDTNARNVFTKVVETRQKIDVPTYRFDVYDQETDTYEIRYWSCCNTPILGVDDEVAYILNTVVDITAEVRAKQAAIENEGRLRLATEAAHMATWDLGLRDHSFISSPRMAEIFGLPADKPVSREELQRYVDADDMKYVVLPAYRMALHTGNYLYEVKIYRPDGELRWIKTQGIVIYDSERNNREKAPVRMLGTVIDITDSKRDEVRKNDFIAMASHELKTPLTSIKAYIQILAKRLSGSGDGFVTNTLFRASNQVDRMTDLIHGFLDLSRLESGKLQLKPSDFDITTLIDETIAEFRLLNPGYTILFDPDCRLTIKADSEKIGQVIGNFLSNALKYSDKEYPITVKCGREDDNLKVSVTDMGIGIRPKDQARVFQRFYRVESEKMRNISGFGIGLYLASEIIHRHKGEIGLESEEGKGSTFYFKLPILE
ncbi:PAS domain-containing protein [Mucilaginibacter sp. BJC16-A38]|uniref:PAS domain-containing sensor histidine kinase n=1 Tax=Mucilaginibacter phenanthrenivorans TaxID=1234842 RepID=UPI00215799AA|nr:ATP-binding protein [Mucilaginibacter phenanthrenivorans]MCR8561718.1 PAS domain-containing protein [Mucilaginibacter phenanthrenivorans]